MGDCARQQTVWGLLDKRFQVELAVWPTLRQHKRGRNGNGRLENLVGRWQLDSKLDSLRSWLVEEIII